MKYLLLLLCLSSFFFTFGQNTIYFQEDFNDCKLPQNWETEQEGNSVGWEINQGTYFDADVLEFPKVSDGCFAGVSDIKYDNQEGTDNVATSDKLILPWLDLSEATSPVIRFSYVSGFGFEVNLFFRFPDGEWMPSNMVFGGGGMLVWQEADIRLAGEVNSPIKNLDQPIQFMIEFKDFGFAKRMGAGVDNIEIFEAPENDIVMLDLGISNILPVGKHDIMPLFENRGASFLKTNEVNWQIDDGAIQSVDVTDYFGWPNYEWSQLYPFGSAAKPLQEIETEFAEAGVYTIKCWTSNPNNNIDANPVNDTIYKEVQVLNILPIKNYIYEKYSHNTCGPCYDADIYLKELLEQNSNIHAVSIHNGSIDPLSYEPAAPLDLLYSQNTHPGSAIDRRYVNITNHENFNHWYDRQYLWMHPWWEGAKVEIVSKEIDQNSGTVSLSLKGTFFADYEGEYRFNVFVVEDSVKAYQAGAPNGANYLHMHVLRDMVGGIWGEENSISIDPENGDVFNYNFEFTIEDNWDVEQVSLIPVIQRHSINADRHFLNSGIIRLTENIISSVNNVDDPDFNIFPNPTTNRATIVFDGGLQSRYKLEIYNATGQKIIFTQFDTNVRNFIDLDLSVYDSGIYFYRILDSEDVLVRSGKITKI